MPQVVLDVSQQMLNYLKRKGFVEIFVRNNLARCEEIPKMLFSVAKPDQKGKIMEVAANAAKKLGLNDNALAAFKNDLLKEINPQYVRKQLAGIAKNQAQNNVMLKELAKNVNGIFSAINSIQAASWLNVALSAANIAATVASTVIICQKLDHIEKKLDQIEKKLDRIEGKIDSIKRGQFVNNIQQPCRAIVMDYKVMVADLDKDKEISEEKMLDLIKRCFNEIEMIYSLRHDYPTGDVLALLYDLLPVFTDMIALYYQYYYDPAHGEYTLHDEWMKIYDVLNSQEFREEIQDYLVFEVNAGNEQINEILDCQYLITLGSKNRIAEVLSDIAMCDSLEDYRDIMKFSEQYAVQQARQIEADLISELGVSEAERIMEPAKKQYMFADV